MQVKPRVRGEPALDLRRPMGAAVVEHEVGVEVGGDLTIDGLQELLELDRTVASVQGADHLARREVQPGVETAGAVTLVVVGGARRRARQHRQDRRGAVQRLDLRLLIDAQHHRTLRRIQVQPTTS